jgi:hypothetical protein
VIIIFNIHTDKKVHHHRCVLDIYGEEDTKKKCPVLIFIHGGSWRVGHRRAWLFCGKHQLLAKQYKCKVVSVGYRRCRMRWWVFYMLYPMTIYIIALCVAVPIVLPWSLFADHTNMSSDFMWYVVFGSALLLSLIYYMLWGLYPRGGGNFESQLDGEWCCNSSERTYETCAYDIARAIRFLYDHAQEYDLDTNRFYLVGHSAGAHLISVIATNPKFLKRYDLDTTIIKGVAGLAGMFSSRSPFFSFLSRTHMHTHTHTQDHTPQTLLTTSLMHHFDGLCTICLCTVRLRQVRRFGTKQAQLFKYPVMFQPPTQGQFGFFFTVRRICTCSKLR